MTRTLALALILTASVAAPWSAFSQSRTAVKRGSGSGSDSGSGASSAPAPAPATAAAPAQASAPAAAAAAAGGESDRPARSVPRRGSNSGGSGSPDSTGTRTRSGDGTNGRTAVAGARPRNEEPVTGQAVARRPESGRSGAGSTVVVAQPGYYGGGYYPWGYGGLGLGGYYGGLYDPWWYDDSPYPGSSNGYGYDGSLKLKIKPRDAQVYVDGYFAGRVDDYDGLFQRLTIDSGPHRIEVREDGFEPLMFEVRIQPGRTVTYSGELKALP